MEGFWSSVSSWWSEKTSSPLYFTYIAFFIVWNWQFFQIIFLESGDLFYSPRIEYITSNLFFAIPFLNTFSDWIRIPIEWFSNFVWHIGPPVLFTFLAIRYLPVLHKLAFDIHVNNYFTRKTAYRSANLEYEKGETVRLKEEVKEKKQQQVQKKAIERIQPEEEKWSQEFRDFAKSPLFYKFPQIISSIYKFDGNLEHNRKSVVDVDIKAAAHAKNLISFLVKKDDVGGFPYQAIALTDKGRFFADNYLQDNPLTLEL